MIRTVDNIDLFESMHTPFELGRRNYLDKPIRILLWDHETSDRVWFLRDFYKP